MVERERDRRKRLWDELISQGGPYSISAQLLRELGIYGGAQGIWANKSVTGFVTTDSHGVTVSLLHRGTMYPDDLFESGVLYHYPSTNRPPTRDYSEIQSYKKRM